MKTYYFSNENELVGKVAACEPLLRLHPTDFPSGRNSTSQICAAGTSVDDGSKNKNGILMVWLNFPIIAFIDHQLA